jgi:phosphoribosyl 1,2-cyclic phosphodiesterase
VENIGQNKNHMVTIKLPMNSEIEITLLGTGGGRFATITQKRRTAGIRIISENLNFHLDSGPGALVYSISEGLNPQKLNAVFVSHCHPDHYTDAEVLIEAMTKGTTKKRGVLVASRSVLHGNEMGLNPVVSKYHQQMPERVRLILCVMRPSGKPWKGHMITSDAMKIIEETHPEQAVLTHFGMQMIFKGPAREAKLIEKETGVPTIAAKDGMQIRLGETINLQKSRRANQGLNKYI